MSEQFDYARMFRLDGRRAVVVGAGSGIGREAAKALAAQGAAVVCADRDLAAVEETVRAARASGTGDSGTADSGTADSGTADSGTADSGSAAGSAEAYGIDILDTAAVDAMAADLGPTDILVVTPGTNVRKRLLDYTRAEFDRVIALNLGGAFDLIRAFGAGMVARGRGSIVACSSIRSQVVEPGQGVYAATKAGIVQLVRAAAAEFGPRGVRVNAVAPGVVETPLTRPIIDRPEWYDAYARKNALGRWASAGELAGAVSFLASDAASYVTGTVLFVDGGWTAIDGRFEPPA